MDRKRYVDFSFQGGGLYQTQPDQLLYCFVWVLPRLLEPHYKISWGSGRGGGGWVSVEAKTDSMQINRLRRSKTNQRQKTKDADEQRTIENVRCGDHSRRP